MRTHPVAILLALLTGLAAGSVVPAAATADVRERPCGKAWVEVIDRGNGRAAFDYGYELRTARPHRYDIRVSWVSAAEFGHFLETEYSVSARYTGVREETTGPGEILAAGTVYISYLGGGICPIPVLERATVS